MEPLRLGVGRWLLTPLINKFGIENFKRMRKCVVAKIKTTFASNYYRSLSFEEALQPDIMRAYATK